MAPKYFIFFGKSVSFWFRLKIVCFIFCTYAITDLTVGFPLISDCFIYYDTFDLIYGDFPIYLLYYLLIEVYFMLSIGAFFKFFFGSSFFTLLGESETTLHVFGIFICSMNFYGYDGYGFYCYKSYITRVLQWVKCFLFSAKFANYFLRRGLVGNYILRSFFNN